MIKCVRFTVPDLCVLPDLILQQSHAGQQGAVDVKVDVQGLFKKKKKEKGRQNHTTRKEEWHYRV